MAQVLLDTFSGHLVLAGSTLCGPVLLGKIGINREHYEGNHVGLANFFFVGVTIEQTNQMLEEIHALFQKQEGILGFTSKHVSTFVIDDTIYNLRPEKNVLSFPAVEISYINNLSSTKLLLLTFVFLKKCRISDVFFRSLYILI
jgi:hypothetical protein